MVGHVKGIVDLDTKVAGRALDLCVAEQQLHRKQRFGSAVVLPWTPNPTDRLSSLSDAARLLGYLYFVMQS